MLDIGKAKIKAPIQINAMIFIGGKSKKSRAIAVANAADMISSG
jgi:hypothetical protein